MEVYNVLEHGHGDAYLIQNAESNPQLTSPLLDQFEAMYNEGTQEFVVDQGLYYPAATNYGYMCTGFESPNDWDDHQRIFGLDGQDIEYMGAQTESLPCVYYTPNYGYSQSPYNPYNPYIPGAMIGVDGPFVGTQQYYSIPSYENPVPSPAYYPMIFQSRPDMISDSAADPFMDTTAFTANGADGSGLKHMLPSAPATFTPALPRSASNNSSSFVRLSEGIKVNAGPSKKAATHGSVTSGGFPNTPSSQFLQGKGSQVTDTFPLGKALSNHNQLKVAFTSDNGLSNFGASTHGRASAEGVWPKLHHGRAFNNVSAIPDTSSEQNRAPCTNKSKNHLVVKAYTTMAGDTDAQGNIIIYTDQYNKDDFPVDYVNAKFFVIKSYSEDDVHKSIKYNVWSSTTNGNKKLNIAYEDAQRLAAGEPRGCPVFLFFSVNASGQFCGVAEMTGPVDFHKDMDFWQQDKWSGSFPVKWHVIKDVPNPNFRHIVLENNENKPVTNSRDTQEIKYKKGMEMLKIFKNYASKTSLLDDFMYYESRQRILPEEKARLPFKNHRSHYFVPVLDTVLDPPRKLNSVLHLPSGEDVKISMHDELNSSEKNVAAPAEQVATDPDADELSTANENAAGIVDEADDNDVLKIGSLTIKPKQAESNPLEHAAASAVQHNEPVNVVTVGSMPVKVNGFAESSGFLTVGSIPLDPRALKLDQTGPIIKSGYQK